MEQTHSLECADIRFFGYRHITLALLTPCISVKTRGCHLLLSVFPFSYRVHFIICHPEVSPLPPITGKCQRLSHLSNPAPFPRDPARPAPAQPRGHGCSSSRSVPHTASGEPSPGHLSPREPAGTAAWGAHPAAHGEPPQPPPAPPGGSHPPQGASRRSTAISCLAPHLAWGEPTAR